MQLRVPAVASSRICQHTMVAAPGWTTHDLHAVGPMLLAGRPDHHVACDRLSPSCAAFSVRCARPSRLTAGGTASRGQSEVVAHASPKLLSSRHKDRDEEPLFRRRARALAKRSARSIIRARPNERHVVLIFGCQRSGTTMLQQTFLDRSWRVPRSILAGTHPRGTRSPSRGTRTRGDDLAGVFHRPGTNPPSPLRGRGSWTILTGICSRFVPGTRWTGDTGVRPRKRGRRSPPC